MQQLHVFISLVLYLQQHDVIKKVWGEVWMFINRFYFHVLFRSIMNIVNPQLGCNTALQQIQISMNLSLQTYIYIYI